ncbi:MAG TPA: hypothetical protein VFA10_17790 [Ktedonobacteraceae bacterium]|nr:hypothetical protein [Ktedonobacteraceae bacterium]
MPKYLSVAQYRAFDDFNLTNDITDFLLARTIARAESDIDDAMGFDLRLSGFEPHVGWVQHQWDAKTMRTKIPNFPVPVRRALRYQIQVSNLSTSGAGFMATINNNDVAYNTFDNYLEIVPLQSITYSLAPVLVQLGLRPPIVQLDYEAGYFLAVTGETLLQADSSNTTYYAQRGFWASSYTQAPSIQPNTLPAIPPVIYKNGVVQSSGFTINYTEGMVTFSSANLSTDVITADYCYTIPDAVRDATVYQTSWLLGQRALNKMGAQGLDLIRSGEQQLKRNLTRDTAGVTALCTAAEQKLSYYLPIAAA